MDIAKACRLHRPSFQFRFYQFLSRPRGVAHSLIKRGWEQDCVLDLSPACRPANYPEIENNLYSRYTFVPWIIDPVGETLKRQIEMDKSILSHYCICCLMGDAVASWLERSTPE